jgi:hypothetical protein
MQDAKQVNDSLNASRVRWGLPLPAIIFLLLLDGLLAYEYSALVAAILAVLIPCGSARLVAIDRNIYRLAVLSIRQKAYYYPGKRAKA